MCLTFNTPLVVTSAPVSVLGQAVLSLSESTGHGHLTSSGLSFLHLWVLLLSTYGEQSITHEEPLQFFFWAFLLSVRVLLTGSANIPSLSHGLATLSKPEAGAAADPLLFCVQEPLPFTS